MTITMASRMSEHRIDRLSHLVRERREARIVHALGSAYPNQVSAKQLMLKTGFSFHTDPVRSFTLLCISISSINQALRGACWQAMRTDGTPEAQYSLSPIGGG